MKCLGKKVPTSWSGRPRKDGVKKEERNHGWFMVIDPCTSRILAIESLDKPENNEVVTKSVTKVLPPCPKVDLLILDRCCHYKPSAINNPELCKSNTTRWTSSTHTATKVATHWPKRVSRRDWDLSILRWRSRPSHGSGAMPIS